MVRRSAGAILLLAGIQGAAGQVAGTVPQEIPTELPSSSFPGATAAESNAAWPSGSQPKRLQAWPQTGMGTANRTLMPCWKTTVLHDTLNDWPGLCMALQHAPDFPTEEECKRFCWDDARCPVWQYNNQTSPGQCWVGFGYRCALRRGHGDTISVQRAQRLMHGDVRVLKNFSGWKINGLYQIGSYAAGGDALSVQRCKAWCYSDIGCEYWQYSTSEGCFVDTPLWSTNQGEDPENQVKWPLTTDGGVTPDAAFEYGEYIQHYCPPYNVPAPQDDDVATHVTTPVHHDGGIMSSPWVWAMLALVSVLGVLFCLYNFMMQGQGEGKRGKRGARSQPEYEQDYDFQEEDKPLMKSGRGQPPYDMMTAQSNDDQMPPPPMPPATMNSMGQQQMPPQGHHHMSHHQMPPPTQLVEHGGQAPQYGYAHHQIPGTQQAMRGPPQLMSQGMPFPVQSQPQRFM